MEKTREQLEDDWICEVGACITDLPFRSWLSSKSIHTRQEALSLIGLLKQHLPQNDYKLIGSLSKDKLISMNDVDVHIILGENSSKNIFLKKLLEKLLEPESIENTDWGGWYFHKTKEFGNVDFFFDIDKFDY